ncbi:MAG TPA: DUF1844 domain-containing protein [Candidatus Subteraquimicrobiales bacterium]
MPEEKKKKGAKKETQAQEKELRERLEKELEKVTVKDVVAQMMISLSSLGYQKLGLPEEANKKYKDLDQAALAIDSLSALIKVTEERISPQEIATFKSTLANLQLKFVSESKK